MIEGLLGKKIGMTHLFASEARVVPVTALEVGPCVVTQIRTKARDGYEAVQIGYGGVKQLNKPAAGHLAASGARVRRLREFGADDVSAYRVGQRLRVSLFQSGDYVDIVSTTKGRGFQGAMKRHGFGGGQKTHGQGDRGRAVGSIGAGTYPGRVLKGKKMPGHMGNKRKTVRRLRVELVDPERNLLFVRGPVPGSRNTMVMIRYAHGVPVSERIEPQIVEMLESAVAAKAAEPAVEPEPALEVEAVEEQAEEAAAEEESGAEEAEAAAGDEPVAEAEAGEEPVEEPAAEAAEAESGEESESGEEPVEEPTAEAADAESVAESEAGEEPAAEEGAPSDGGASGEGGRS